MKFYLKIIGSAVLAAFVAFSASVPHYDDGMAGLFAPEDHGWVAPETGGKQLYGDPPEVESGKGQVRLLYKEWEEATGYRYISRHQTAPDCVGQATACGLDMRQAVQALEGLHRVPQQEVDASSIYGLSRIEIGNTRWAAGSQVGWAMEAVTDYGLLYKKNYLYAGYDLSNYNANLSRTWGRKGLPSVLERIAELTPVVEYYQVHNYEQVRDAINAGFPVVVGSDVGFSRRTIFTWGNTKATRDSDGFLRWIGTWNHAMCFVGVDDRSRRKGCCCQNSWGKSWVNGPKKLGQDEGSFWVDAKNVTAMARQGDAFAIVQVNSPLQYRLSL